MRTTQGLDALFAPSSIAIVGASDDPDRIGGRPIAYLKQVFPGRILPVSRSRDVVQGLPAVASVGDLDDPPDLVIVAIPAADVPTVARECAGAGARSLLVFSSGFAETGEEGARLQAQLTELAASTGVRICGPNCIGQVNLPDGAITTFGSLPDPHLRPGNVGIVSQSGAYGATLFKLAHWLDLPISHALSTGNEADVTVTDALAWLVERPEVEVVVGFSETIAHPDLFLEVARRAHELDKPLLFLKGGSSEAGARAAVSHTGSIVGADDVVDAVFRQYGVIRPRSSMDVIDWARALSTGRRARGRRVGIVTSSGGVGILMADAAADAGLEVPELAPDQRQAIGEVVPAFGSTANPIDVTGHIVNDMSVFTGVLKAVADIEALDAIAVAGLSDHVEEERLSALAELARVTDKPLVAWTHGSSWVPALGAHGIAAYVDPVVAMRALGVVVAHSLRPAPPPASAPPPDPTRAARAAKLRPSESGGATLLEHQAKQLLALYGVPVVAEELVHDGAEAAAAADRLGYPVALKVVSPDLPHKSDVGGIQLGLTSRDEVRDGYDALMTTVGTRQPGARIEGVLVQAMAPPGLELVCGLRRDPAFGPVVAVGLGGVLVEIIGEVVLRRAPLTEEQARAALAELHQGRLVGAPRGLSPAAVTAVARLMVSVGTLGCELPELCELDLNPVIVGEDGPLVVDALGVLHR